MDTKHTSTPPTSPPLDNSTTPAPDPDDAGQDADGLPFPIAGPAQPPEAAPPPPTPATDPLAAYRRAKQIAGQLPTIDEQAGGAAPAKPPRKPNAKPPAKPRKPRAPKPGKAGKPKPAQPDASCHMTTSENAEPDDNYHMTIQGNPTGKKSVPVDYADDSIDAELAHLKQHRGGDVGTGNEKALSSSARQPPPDVDRAWLIAAIEKRLKSTKKPLSPAEFDRLTTQLLRLRGWDTPPPAVEEVGPPDPAYVIEYLRQCAMHRAAAPTDTEHAAAIAAAICDTLGMTPADLAGALGGLRANRSARTLEVAHSPLDPNVA